MLPELCRGPPGLLSSRVLQLPPAIYTITLYTPQHQEISWEGFAKIFSYRISFITISRVVCNLHFFEREVNKKNLSNAIPSTPKSICFIMNVYLLVHLFQSKGLLNGSHQQIVHRPESIFHRQEQCDRENLKILIFQKPWNLLLFSILLFNGNPDANLAHSEFFTCIKAVSK